MEDGFREAAEKRDQLTALGPDDQGDQEGESAVEEGDRIIVTSTWLNGGRYNGRTAKVIEPDNKGRLVAKLDHYTPGLDSPDGVIYLRPDEWEVQRGA